MAHLALGDQCGHRTNGLLNLSRLRRPVRVVQIDYVDAQAQQRCLAGPLDVPGLAANDAAAIAARPVDTELRGELHLLAASGDRPADKNFVMPGSVDVGGVQERHA